MGIGLLRLAHRDRHAVLLTALVAAAGAALGMAWADDLDRAAQNGETAKTVGIAGAIVVAVVLFIAYYCGGYVAGRIARFNGMKQGIAVWIWTILMTIVVAVSNVKRFTSFCCRTRLRRRNTPGSPR